jgi:hypothetical protein
MKVIGALSTSRGGSISLCNFGKIITIPAEGETPAGKAIRGGIIHVGDQTLNIEPQELNLASSGVWLVSIEIDCEANRDDDDEVLLPGIVTGSFAGGDWTKTAFTGSEDYPSNTAPELPSGEGVIHLPIGKLTIADGVAKLEPVGCGNFTVTHCAGTLGYSRA